MSSATQRRVEKPRKRSHRSNPQPRQRQTTTRYTGNNTLGDLHTFWVTCCSMQHKSIIRYCCASFLSIVLAFLRDRVGGTGRVTGCLDADARPLVLSRNELNALVAATPRATDRQYKYHPWFRSKVGTSSGSNLHIRKYSVTLHGILDGGTSSRVHLRVISVYWVAYYIV